MYIQRAPIPTARTIQPAPSPLPLSQTQQNINEWRAKRAAQQNIPKRPPPATKVYFTPN